MSAEPRKIADDVSVSGPEVGQLEFHTGQTWKSVATSSFHRLELLILFLHENVEGFRMKTP